MTKLLWLLVCIVLAAVVIWRNAPLPWSPPTKFLVLALTSVASGALLYFLGAVAATIFWGA